MCKKGPKCKYRTLLFVFSSSLLFLSGCWDRVEVNDLAIVTGAGIDITEDDEIELSIQVFMPKAMSIGEGGGGGGENITYIASQTGKNIMDALSKLQGKFPREIFWGQCKVFIFGERLAKKGIHRQMDFLLRHPEPRGRAAVFVSEGKARSVLELEPNLERYSAEVLREIANYRIGLQMTIQDIDEMLTGISQSVSIPYVKIQKQKITVGKSNQYAHIDGAAVFKKGKMVGTISEAEARGVLWLRNEIEGYTISVEIDDEEELVSLNPVSARVDLVPTIQDDHWKVDVNIETEGAIVQNETNIAFTEQKTLEKVELAYEKSIETRIQDVLQILQHKLNTDVVNFSREFYRKYPKERQTIEDHWEEIFPEVEVNINVNAHIRREGAINEPGALPINEIKR